MLYAQSTMIATRKAFGTALADLGAASSQIVCLDGDVKNSTYTEDFEHVYPDRFVQCLVAEQNMVSVAVGLERRGKIPFAATFGAFFSRAHDQIRMAAIGTSPLRLVGSHAGVSIGQDGPSQMALEDIALMRTLPQSIVLYPCDAVSTRALVTCMANYHDGISYLRTTRAATPIIYHEDEQFVIGGCKVIREYIDARACIIAAGVTVFEALKAHDILLKNNIRISIIDLYSVKPLDAATISRVAAQSDNFIITVEDHYAQGGIGEAVCASLATMSIAVAMLAVRKLPRSGTPEELRAFCSIDAQAIIDAVTGH
jgi:transketolase